MRQSGIVVGQIEEGSAVEESAKVDAKEWKDSFKSYFIQVFTLLMKLFRLMHVFSIPLSHPPLYLYPFQWPIHWQLISPRIRLIEIISSHVPKGCQLG